MTRAEESGRLIPGRSGGLVSPGREAIDKFLEPKKRKKAQVLTEKSNFGLPMETSRL